MSENYIMLNGKRVDLTEEQLEKLGLKVEKNDCFKREYKQAFCFIGEYGEVCVDKDNNANAFSCNELYNVANYCTDKSIMEQRALHETLDRLLWRFSMQNDGDKIDWSKQNHKFTITYDYYAKRFHVNTWSNYKIQGSIYFYTEDTAQRAIDEIVLPFMKEHPEFVW